MEQLTSQEINKDQESINIAISNVGCKFCIPSAIRRSIIEPESVEVAVLDLAAGSVNLVIDRLQELTE